MATDYLLREARSDDFESLVALATASADTGRIRVAPKYLVNPVDAWAALKPELVWVVAEGEDGLIGGGQVIFGEAEIEGEIYRAATLGSLMVHPAHRRQGIAKAVTRWRIDRAGPDAVVLAGIQTGNAGSFANARSWATQIFGKLVLPGFRVKSGGLPPRGLEIREPESDSEWEQAAEGLARFEQGWNLRIPKTAERLRERSEVTFQGERYQRYLVALERGRVVGGFELFDGARLQSLVFEHIPAPLRALNLFLRVFPRDGDLRANTFSSVWWAQDRDDVARVLWAYVCSAAAESGNAIGTSLDPRGPLRKFVPLRPWTPKAEISLAIRSPVPLSEERLLSAP
jgi:GNAT superfamily N-acetyltransferase